METTTMKENKYFSSERFATLAKADLAVNKSNYLKMIIGGTGVFVAVSLLVSILALIDINSLKQMSELAGMAVDEAIKIYQSTYGSL